MANTTAELFLSRARALGYYIKDMHSYNIDYREHCNLAEMSTLLLDLVSILIEKPSIKKCGTLARDLIMRLRDVAVEFQNSCQFWRGKNLSNEIFNFINLIEEPLEKYLKHYYPENL